MVLYRQRIQGPSHLQYVAFKRVAEFGQGLPVVDGAQGFRSASAQGDQTVEAGGQRHCGVQQSGEKARVEARHVAGRNQVPGAGGDFERGYDAAQGSAAGQPVLNHRPAEVAIAERIADNDDCSRRFFHLRGGLFEQRAPVSGEHRLVGSHSSAAAAREDESSGRHAPGCAHEKMIALASSDRVDARDPLVRNRRHMLSIRNKMVYICFLIWGIMSSAGVYAASAVEPSHAATVVVRADRRTGRLVRTVVVNPKVIPPKASADANEPGSVSEMVEQAAKSYDVDPLLVHSVIQVESNYDPYAISNKGAEGLMQLIPATARRFGATNSFSPRENIQAGVRYLKYLKNIFGDDRLALAAYNAGEATVARYGWIPPYAETQQYVNNVGRRYGEARRKAAAQPKPAQPAALTPAIDEHPKLEQYRDEQGRVYLRTR